jgi:hypothetical protein
MRRLLRPAANPGRRAEPRVSSARAKVKRLLEAMVDAATEDLASGAEKPRVSYGQALRAGELLVRYEAEESEEQAEPAEVEAQDEETEDEAADWPEAEDPAPHSAESEAAPSARTG